MDFVDGLPRSDGNNSIMVIVDRLTKSAHFVPLSHPYTASVVANKFIANIVKLHGTPRSIVSDRDPIFVSLFWREFWKISGTTLNMSTAYHPESDGQTEVVNRCLEQYLRCFVSHRPTQWNGVLPWAELWYNCTYHSSIRMTPFEALFGRAPPAIPTYETGSSLNDEIDEQLQNRDELLAELKNHLGAANNRMKQNADAHRRDVEFVAGDWVFLRLQPYRQQSVFRRSSQKLANKFYGPFQIVKRVGTVAYHLCLPKGTKIHPVFHVSLLKKRVGENEPATGSLPPMRENGNLILQPATAIKQRWVSMGEKNIQETLIKWNGMTEADSTWEDIEQLRKDKVLLHEDKVLLQEFSRIQYEP